jgi:glycine betaine/choline ABC-type transport system substrate-binding protein
VREWGLTAGSCIGWRRLAVAVLLAVALGCIGGGCGADSAQNSDMTLTVGSKDTTEEVILGEIYAQALEAAGYKVKRDHRLPAGLPPFEQKGLRISGYPEHLNIALKDILKIKRDVPGDPTKAYEIAKEGLEERGLTAFPPTRFSRSKAVGMLRKTAEERDLKTLSELRGQAGEMSLKAGGFCRFLTDCLAGIERLYGISFEAFTDIEPALRYKVLETGEADASMLLSTEGRLAGKNSKFVILEDDKHRLPAGHVFWVTTTDVAEEAGPSYEKAIVAAQKGLTLKVMQRLDAAVNFKKKPPAEVAAKYLKSIDYGGKANGSR